MNDDVTARMHDLPHDPGSLVGVVSIRLDSNDIELKIEGDASLHDVIRLIADPGPHAPALIREDDEMVVFQRGRYRGSAAVLRVPEHGCPPITGSHDRGAMNYNHINTSVSLQHGAGDLRFVGGTGALDVASGRGDIVIDSRTGHIDAKIGAGDMRLVHASGALAVSLGRGNIALDSCNGHLLLKSGSGDVSSTDCGGSLTVKTGSGDITIARPRDLRVDTKSGNGDVGIRGGSLTGLQVRSGRGNITSTANLVISHGDDHAKAQSDQRFPGWIFGKEDFDDDFGIADLMESKGVEFTAGDKGLRIARGPFEFEASDAGLRIGKGSFSFVANDEGLRIITGGDATPGKFDVQTSKGDIAIQVPANVPTRVETIINSGDVHSDIPLVSVGRPGPRGTTQRFVGVSGTPSATERLSIKLKTNRGDITIRSVAQPSPPSPPRWQEPPQSPQPPQPPHPSAPGFVAAVPAEQPDREERMRSILEALSRGQLNVDDAERMLAELERDGSG